MKFLYLILTVLFLVFAGLQWNDPDPIHWTLGYLAVSVSCGLAAFGKYPRWWLWSVTVVIGVWMLTTIPAAFHWVLQGEPDITGEMKATTPIIEEMREFLGLLIAFVTMVYLVLAGRKRGHTSPRHDDTACDR